VSVAIAPIVEGHAEVQSVRVLLRRIFAKIERSDVQVVRPFRVKRTRIVRPGELERAVKQAIRDRENVRGVLVLLDADDDCPAKLEPCLLKRCKNATPLPVRVVLANREFEGWFLGAKESLRGVRGIREDAAAPVDPEAIRGAKERISGNMVGSRYLEVDDQPALAARMNLEMAKQRCPSFERLLRNVEFLVSRLGIE